MEHFLRDPTPGTGAVIRLATAPPSGIAPTHLETLARIPPASCRLPRHRPDPEGDLARLAGVNPLQRLGLEAEVAALAAHLLSDESAWTTGTLIPIDGGATAVF